MPIYTITSTEGAEKYGGEVGDVVHLDLDEGEALAVVCAGWIQPGDVPVADNDNDAGDGDDPED